MPKPKNDPQPARAQQSNVPVPRREDEDAYTPTVGLERASGSPPPMLPPSLPFLLTWHEERWLVMGDQVIPELRKWKLRAGINGVEAHPKTGEIIAASLKTAMAEAETSHRVHFLPPDVDGPGTSYLRKPKGTDAVLLKWERTYSGSPQITCDEAGYVGWCRSLVERGIIPPPPLRVLERLRAEALKRLEDHAQIARGEDSTTARHRRQLEVIDRELALAMQRDAAEDEPVTLPAGV